LNDFLTALTLAFALPIAACFTALPALFSALFPILCNLFSVLSCILLILFSALSSTFSVLVFLTLTGLLSAFCAAGLYEIFTGSYFLNFNSFEILEGVNALDGFILIPSAAFLMFFFMFFMFLY
jgi:hypothetical protein